jgi:hypothetical protein
MTIAPTLDPASTPEAHCLNCRTPLLGAHCHACGQPSHNPIRHVGHVLEELAEVFWHLDGRIFRTLRDLLVPGRLALNYLAGQRARYVAPLRLFVVLCVLAFFVARLSLDFGDRMVELGHSDGIGQATSRAEVRRLHAAAQVGLAQDRAALSAGATAERAELDAALAALGAEARARIAVIEAAERDGRAVPVAPPPAPLNIHNRPWDPVSNPLLLPGLPGFANVWLNRQVGRAGQNLARLREDPSLFKHAFLGAIPSTLFVLVPVFALLLKLAYPFRRRLYLEHLLVTLYSHAFLCLALLLGFLATGLQRWLAPAPGTVQGLFGWLDMALLGWMPLYLLLMQKRVYGQGWRMTTLKFSLLGASYLALLGLGVLLTVLASLVWM